MRVVLDTNTLVSAIISPLGAPAQLFESALQGRFELCTSLPLLAELDDVLKRNKFSKKLASLHITADQVVLQVHQVSHVVSPASVPRVVPNDIDDDQVIACAVEAAADWIVSGDQDILAFCPQYQNIRILTAPQALDELRALR